MAANLSALIVQVQDYDQGIKSRLFDIGQDVALDGQTQMREHLETATTDWGQARQAGEVTGRNRDGSPKPGPRQFAGRVENEDMIDKITSVAEWVDANTLEIRWGWQDADYQAYFGYQEHGTAHIAPAESLQFSLDRAEDILRGRLNALG